MTLTFPGGDTPLPQATLSQLLESAEAWLQLANAALSRSETAEFYRCMGFYDRAIAEAKTAK